MTANDIYREAQRLIRLGQPVFPCKSSGAKAKAPLTRNGLLDATTDKDQIRDWLKRFPDAALAIPTGIIWDVLDVDEKPTADGRAHLDYLRRVGLLNGCKFVVKTPSGGYHLYFKSTPTLTNKAHGASLGLDVRAKGGYVLVPPSKMDAGEYENVGDTTGGDDTPLLWNSIVSALAPVDQTTKNPIPLLPSERKSSISALREWLSVRQSGERNNALHWAVCRCLDSGIDPYELVEAAQLCGLGSDEIELTISSAIRRVGATGSDLKSEGEVLFGE